MRYLIDEVDIDRKLKFGIFDDDGLTYTFCRRTIDVVFFCHVDSINVVGEWVNDQKPVFYESYGRPYSFYQL